jgi:hypothetical protein
MNELAASRKADHEHFFGSNVRPTLHDPVKHIDQGGVGVLRVVPQQLVIVVRLQPAGSCWEDWGKDCYVHTLGERY